jgi:endonuclease YncB( thermonuclease family)
MKPLVLLAALLAPCSPALAQPMVGLAQPVDGDTLKLGTIRIRLFGIDAPEAVQKCKIKGAAWACGTDATAALRSMVDGKQVTCEAMDKDVYGRTVARCQTGGLDVGAEMVRIGPAVVIGGGTSLYDGLEAQGRAYKTGIWASEFEMPGSYREARSRAPSEQIRRVDRPRTTAVRRQPSATGSMFYSCAAARAAGAAPMYRGQPGYNPNLDGDNDGIACEPYRGRR